MDRYETLGYDAAAADDRGGSLPTLAALDVGALWQWLGLDDGGREAAAIEAGDVPGVTLDEAREAVVRGYREALAAVVSA
jgi:2-methylcitrate dehydratase PrpD